MADNVLLNAGSGGATLAADDIGSVHYPRSKLSLGADGSATDAVGGAGAVSSAVQRVTLASDDPAVSSLGTSSRGDTFTGVASGTTVNVSTYGRKYFAIQVKGTGAAATSWTVHLETSLNGTNFTSLISHNNSSDSDGNMKWAPVGNYPALYFRSNCTALTLGSATNIVVTIVGMP